MTPVLLNIILMCSSTHKHMTKQQCYDTYANCVNTLAAKPELFSFDVAKEVCKKALLYDIDKKLKGEG